MIIFGVKVKESRTETGTFLCPKCRTPQHYRRLSLHRWFSLYFIPVIPLGRIGEQAECQGCFSRYDARILWEGAAEATDEQERHGAPGTTDPPSQPGMGPGTTSTPPSASAEQPVHNPFLAEQTTSGASSGHPSSQPAAGNAGQPQPVYNPFVAEQGMAPGMPQGVSTPAAATSSLATVSLIMALVSPFLLLFCGMSLFTSIAAVITGHTALRQIRASRGAIEGRGIALSGLIGGYFFFAFSAILIGLFFVPALIDGWNGGSSRNRRVASRPAPVRTPPPVRSFPASSSSPGFNPSSSASPPYRPPAFDPSDIGTPSFDPPSIEAPRFNPPTSPLRPGGADRPSVQAPAMDDPLSERGRNETGIPERSPFVPMDEVDEPQVGARAGARSPMNGGFGGLGRTPPDFSRPGISNPPNPFQPVDPDDAFEDAKRRAEESRRRMEEMIAESRADIDRLRQGMPGIQPPPLSRNPFPGGMPGRDRPARQGANGPPAQPQVVKPEFTEDPKLAENVVQQFPAMGTLVQSIRFSPDGKRLVIGKIDRSVSVLDIESGEVVDVSKDIGELGSVEQVAFTNDGKTVVAGGARGAITLIPLMAGGKLGNPQPRAPHPRSVDSLVVSPTGKFLMTGSRGDVMWQPLAGDQTRKLDVLDRKVIALYLPPQGTTAMATDGSELARVDLRGAKIVNKLSVGRQFAHAAAFSPDGKRLALSRGKTIAIVDTETGEAVTEIETDHTINWIVKFTPDGRQLVAGGRGEAEVWDVETGRQVTEFDLGGVLYVQAISISPDGTLLAAIPSSSGQTLKVFRMPETE